MKRTLIVATTSYAGMGPYVSEIVNTFSPDDDIWYFFHDYEDEFFKKNVKNELHEKCVFVKQANSAKNKLLNLITNKEAYDKRIIEFCSCKNIQIIHYINGAPTLAMQDKFKKMGVVLISTVHDFQPHEMNKIWYKQLRQKILNERLLNNLSATEKVITNSQEQVEKLKERFPNKDIYFHPFPSLVTKEIKLGGKKPKELPKIEKPYILFFGRIEEYKGVNNLYKAFVNCSDLCNNYNLVIAGRGTLGFEINKEEKNVILIQRYINDDEVACLYRNASCVVYPYLSATQSGVLSLAFFFQVPVLTSDVPFFANILNDSNLGLMFERGNWNDLTVKLLKLLNSDTTQMKKNELLYYQEHYDGAAIRKQLLEIYEKQ